MIATDCDALLCDLAETYHVFDFYSVPVMTLATLCTGLREDSRIMMKLVGIRYVSHSLLLATIADQLILLRQNLFASETDSAPRLYTDLMTGIGEDLDDGKYMKFESGEAFEETRRKILAKVNANG